jgi:hypothetical protein
VFALAGRRDRATVVFSLALVVVGSRRVARAATGAFAVAVVASLVATPLWLPASAFAPIAVRG